MSRFTFDQDIGKAEFLQLAQKDGVKSHFLGSYTWGKVAEKQGWKVHYVGARENGEVVATALLQQKPLVMGYSYFYIPRGFTMDYTDHELLSFMTNEVSAFCKRHKGLYFRIDPDIKLQTIDLEGHVIDGEDNRALVDYLVSLGYKHKPLNYFFENEQPRFTFRIDIEPAIEEIEDRYGKTTRNILKQTYKNAIEVFVGNECDISEFNRLMRITEKRQDFFAHKDDYYEFFYDTLKEDDMVALYIGRIDIPKLKKRVEEERAPLVEEKSRLESSKSRKASGKLKEVENRLTALDKQLDQLADKPQGKINISAYMMVYYEDKAWTLYAGNDMEYSKFYANYAVYRQAIKDAHDKGKKVFDGFGTVGRTGVDPHLDGLQEFKKKWGGEYTEFIGEFDHIENKLMYFLYSKLIPIYHKRQNKKLRSEIKNG